MYTIHKRDQVKRMLSRTELYFPACEAALDRHDLPMYLKYLPVILSTLTPHAKSSSGASGLWQLPYGTARLYGLESNDYIDERRDPALSSEVAAKPFEKPLEQIPQLAPDHCCFLRRRRNREQGS